jgi:diguanylate cyclase (GGDEF)-like protein
MADAQPVLGRTAGLASLDPGAHPSSSRGVPAPVARPRFTDVSVSPGERRHAGTAAFMAAVSLSGLSALVALLLSSRHEVGLLSSRPELWMLLALALVAELWPLVARGAHGSDVMSSATIFGLATLLVFGLPAAVLVQASAAVVAGLVGRRAWWALAFTVSAQTLALTAAAWALDLGGLVGVPAGSPAPDATGLGWLALAGVVCFAVGAGLRWSGLALLRRGPLVPTVVDEAGPQLAAQGVLVGMAPLAAVVTVVSWPLLPLFLLPLLAVEGSAAGTLERRQHGRRDPLTGLASRQELFRRTQETIRAADARGDAVALFLLDLDRFKEINDTLGHRVGDRILRLAAERMERTLRPGDVVARLGGDEFAVLLPVVRDAQAAREIATRILAALEAPFTVGETPIHLEASIGIALHPQHAGDFERLLQRADVAMYLAKSEHTAIETYSVERDTNSRNRLGLLGALRRAVDRRELELHYQPKIRVEDGAVAGVEALVRWRHPTRGLVLPDEFIPLAERSGLMPRLTDLVISLALAQLAEWRRQGLRLPVAVNVSMRDLLDGGFADRLGSLLRHFGVPAHLLCLEITERVLMADGATAADTLTELDTLGVRISLDDFGTGYSSLVLLKRLPVREIKVDRSFVARLGQEGADEDTSIVRSIIDLGHSLGLSVVAEGVESAAGLARLRELGCDRAQGWHVSQALPPAEATSWLRRRSPGLFPVQASPG